MDKFEAVAEAEDFKQDFFGTVDVLHWAPQRGDLGCVSVSEFSTDLDDEAKTLLCCPNCNASVAEFLVSLAEVAFPTKFMRFVFGSRRTLSESGKHGEECK